MIVGTPYIRLITIITIVVIIVIIIITNSPPMIVGTPYIRLITCSVLATFSELTYLVCAIYKLGKIKI